LLHIPTRKAGPRNFFDLATMFPSNGVGLKFARKNWGIRDCYWRITRVKLKVAPDKFDDDNVHGKAWGVLTWRGESDGRERPLRGVYKKVWGVWSQPNTGVTK
jgi:small subunit ribosomal protein S34